MEMQTQPSMMNTDGALLSETGFMPQSDVFSPLRTIGRLAMLAAGVSLLFALVLSLTVLGISR